MSSSTGDVPFIKKIFQKAANWIAGIFHSDSPPSPQPFHVSHYLSPDLTPSSFMNTLSGSETLKKQYKPEWSLPPNLAGPVLDQETPLIWKEQHILTPSLGAIFGDKALEDEHRRREEARQRRRALLLEALQDSDDGLDDECSSESDDGGVFGFLAFWRKKEKAT
jgi:hypothetical protein